MANRTNPEQLTDEKWHAILCNDTSCDGRFFYAVKTTGIFCRPSCKSRPPLRENIGIFQTAEQALNADYRPCKRCRPTGLRLPDDEWVALAAAYIDRNYGEALSLNKLAELSHGSPYHLHRTFKRVQGITPMAYVQQVRIENAKRLLTSSNMAIAEVGVCVGLSNTPYFITLFRKTTGSTPANYRQHARISIFTVPQRT